ncbi:MAG: BMP family ABC transporter substrate-binding protein [Chloroflexi bacterium]|nr:BMP family ABC transporter substrate-binding protein [Chloroflexota bacterium]
MKRLIFALLLVVVLAACAPAPAPAPTAAPPTAAPAAKPFRVAFIMPSAVNDMAFSQSMYDALVIVQKEMGGKDKLDFVYTDNMGNVPDAAAAIRDYATKGFDLVIAHGSQYGASLADIAPDFPKTAFAWGTAVDTFASKGVKNISAYTVQADQGGYVLGVMAAKLSKTGKFGLIGPIPAGDGKLHIDGFEAGVKATNPSASVAKTFTQSFSDAALMSQAAQTMIANGADMLTGTSQAVVGAIAVAKDKNAFWFGNQSEQVKLAPKNVIATQVYDWTPFVKLMIDNTKAGKLGGEVMIGTLKNKVLVVKYNSEYALPADVKKLADDTVQGLIDGKIQTGVK